MVQPPSVAGGTRTPRSRPAVGRGPPPPATVPDALFSQEPRTPAQTLLPVAHGGRSAGYRWTVYSDRHAVFKHTGEPARSRSGPNPVRPRHGKEMGDTSLARSPLEVDGPDCERDGGDIPGPAGDRCAWRASPPSTRPMKSLHRFPRSTSGKFGEEPPAGSSLAITAHVGVMDGRCPWTDLLQAPPQGGQGHLAPMVKYNWRTVMACSCCQLVRSGLPAGYAGGSWRSMVGPGPGQLQACSTGARGFCAGGW